MKGKACRVTINIIHSWETLSKKKKETLDDIPHNVYKHVTTPLHHLPLHLLAKNEEKKENETEQTPVDCIVFPGSGTEVSRRPFRQREATR